MSTVANRRSVMTLFSRPDCPYSHRARLVLSEKSINYEIVHVEKGELPEDLVDLNPYQTLPTLVDRDLALYEIQVISEYLDERFPHPPLMPVDPVSRATVRLTLYRVEHDWYRLVRRIEAGGKDAQAARKEMRESILASDDVFGAKPFFLSDEFSLADCSIVPLLWRLPSLNVELPEKARAVAEYAERMFERPSFQDSLTEQERELRP